MFVSIPVGIKVHKERSGDILCNQEENSWSILVKADTWLNKGQW